MGRGVRLAEVPPRAGWGTNGEEETRRLGSRLAADLPPGAVLLVSGDLGAGKTVLAQGIAEGLGIDPREVVSPTYTLVHEHGSGERRFVHVDLYRLAPEEVAGVGLEEALAGPGIKFVEWGERLPFEVPGAYRVEVRRDPESGACARRIEIRGGDPMTMPLGDRATREQESRG
jgi:tRNA threonylcarbamoyladenosine biosynthesis protein TsaE